MKDLSLGSEYTVCRIQESSSFREQDYTQDTGNTRTLILLKNRIILRIQIIQEPLFSREHDYTQDTDNTRTLIL